MSTSTWNNEYVEILEFFFWESQHLGKQKNPQSRLKKLNEVLSHLREMEVTLNHQFNLFFALLPQQILRELLGKCFQHTFVDTFIIDSRETRKCIESLGRVTQPDILLFGQQSLAAIEMKVAAKSSLEQLMKYLLLSLLENDVSGKPRMFHLLFLGKDDFTKLFKEGYNNIAELREAFMSFALPKKSRNGGIDLTPYHERLRRLGQEANISYLSYRDLSAVLRQIMAPYNGNEPGHEVIRKLISGLLNELHLRKLD